MRPRIGRPTIENPKTERITVRLDKETMLILQEYCSQENIDKAEAVRLGIKKLEPEIKK